MIIVSINGRLGNQMFAFALYYYLQKIGKDVYVDLTCNRASGDGNIISDVRYNADIFNLKYQIADPAIVEEMYEERKQRDIWKRWEYRLFPSHCKFYEEKNTGTYDKRVFKLDNVYLHGYWQSEKYFSSIKEEIRQMYKFPDLCTDYQKRILEEIDKKNATSVHIRRGDYMLHPEIYGTTGPEYYAKAMEYIQERNENVHFFLFTNDVSWAKENYNKRNITIIEETKDLMQSNLDMRLMAHCKNNIIANSSFSWWGAWLNENPEKLVIAPKRWEVSNKTKDIWCDNWIKI